LTGNIITGNAVISRDVLLTSDTPIKTIGNYNLELISASDTSATIRITSAGISEIKEINEGDSKTICGINVKVTNADENSLKLTAKLNVNNNVAACISSEIGESYTKAEIDQKLNDINLQSIDVYPVPFELSTNNDYARIHLANVYYHTWLVSANDTSAMIKIKAGPNGTEKVVTIKEGATYQGQLYSIKLLEADETNLKLSAKFLMQ